MTIDRTSTAGLFFARLTYARCKKLRTYPSYIERGATTARTRARPSTAQNQLITVQAPLTDLTQSLSGATARNRIRIPCLGCREENERIVVKSLAIANSINC